VTVSSSSDVILDSTRWPAPEHLVAASKSIHCQAWR